MVHQKCSACILGVGGDELAILGITQLPVLMGGVTHTIEFKVVLSCLALILLGTGTLQEFDVSVQFGDQELVLPGGIQVLFKVMAKASAQYGVFLAEELTLDAHTVTWCHMWLAEGPE